MGNCTHLNFVVITGCNQLSATGGEGQFVDGPTMTSYVAHLWSVWHNYTAHPSIQSKIHPPSIQHWPTLLHVSSGCLHHSQSQLSLLLCTDRKWTITCMFLRLGSKQHWHRRKDGQTGHWCSHCLTRRHHNYSYCLQLWRHPNFLLCNPTLGDHIETIVIHSATMHTA